jgi:hypothetical protein
MRRPLAPSLALLAVPLLAPPARAQHVAADSVQRPAFVAPYRYPSLRLPPLPALAPGGWLGPRTPPALVAAAWASRVQDSLRRGIAALPAPAGDTTAAGALAALAALPVPVAPQPEQAGPPGLLGEFANLGLDMSLRFELKADRFRNLRCDALARQQALSGCAGGFPTISPNPQYAIRSGGVVGRRLHLNVDFDSQREFDANNNLQLWYEGLEDEMLRRVEAGNVTFQVPSSRFISAAIPANNFGIQAIGQIGPLEVRGIYAQQKGNVVRDRTYTVGETTTEPLDRDFRDLDYEQGRFFFVVDPAALPGYPAVDVLNLPSGLPDSLRVGSLLIYRVRSLSAGGGTNQNLRGINAVACGPGTQAVDCAGERAGPFQWDLLQEGRDYYVDPSGLWIALANRLDVNDYLAVSYMPVGVAACGPGSRCVGTFPLAGNPDTAVVDTLRLVYDPRPGVTARSPSFRFEIRSAYRIGGPGLDRSGVELRLLVNQRERPDGSTETYLGRLGLALATDPTTFDQYNRLFPRDRDPQQGAPLQDYYVVFPHLQPFADSSRLPATERNDSLYRTPRGLLVTEGPPSLFVLRLHAQASAASDEGTLSLSSFQIREGSEKLYLGNRLLTRDVDYSIDYTIGLVTFKNPGALFGGGPGVIHAQFEERSSFVTAPTSIYGLAAKYDVGTAGQLYFTGLFQKQETPYTRPQLGFEPSSGFIGGVSGNFHFQPAWITRAVNALPGPKSDASSFLTLAGEVALSQPQPNRVGQAYLEEFEAQAGRFISLNENSWHWGSVPSSVRGTAGFGIPSTGFDTLDAVPLTWQSLPIDSSGRPMEFFAQQIDPTIRLVGQAQSIEPALWLMLKPDTMMGLADSRANSPTYGVPNWRRPGTGNNARTATRWRSITQTLSTTGVDLSRVEYLEFWVWEDNLRTARANHAAILFDFGSVFEDALAFEPDSFTAVDGDTTYYGVRVDGRGRLDTEREPLTQAWNAATDDEGILSDRVVDGIRNATTGELIDTLPLCSASVNGQIVSRRFGDPLSRCGRHNGAVDTEDQDGDDRLDINVGARTVEDFVRFVFAIGDDRYFVRDGVMTPVPPAQGGGASGWRLYRIPFRTDTLQVGSPNLRQVQAVRITVLAPETAAPGEPDPEVSFGLSRVRLVGSTWLKRADTPLAGLGGDRGAGTGEVTVSVVSTENQDLGYVPPPGVVDQASQAGAGFQTGVTQINEQSLRLLASGLTVGERAEAFTRFGSEGDKNFLTYRTLRAWARGRGPGWEDGDLEFFIKVGKDADNFYLYHVPARTTSWLPEVVIGLGPWVSLRGQIEQAWLHGVPPGVGPGCPDSTIVPFDSAYVRCDGPYIAHVRDPGNAPPNLAAVQEIAVGMLRVASHAIVDQSELWVDDIRLSDVVETAGTAAALDVALTAGNLVDATLNLTRRDGNFRQLGEDPSYVTNQALALAATVHLERMLPQAWGLVVPLSVQSISTAGVPEYLPSTDLRASALAGLRTPRSGATSYSLAIRRSRRATHGAARYLLDPVTLSASYASGSDRSSLAAATSRTYGTALDYALTPPAATVAAVPTFLRWLVRWLPGDGAERARLRLSPTSIRFRSAFVASEGTRISYRIPVADTGDTNLPISRAAPRAWRNSFAVDLLPFSDLQLRADVASERDLRDYGDSTGAGRVSRLARRSLLGADVGFESQRTVGTFVGLTPQIGGWLRPRATLSTRFSLTRDPNRPTIREGDDSTGAFRLPVAFSNGQHLDLASQVDLGRLGRGLLGDSSLVARWLARVTSLDVGVGRDRGSTFSQAPDLPALGYQIAWTRFDGFRSQQGLLASSATDRTTGHSAATLSLPLGLRVTALYQRLQSTTWLLRVDSQVPLHTRTLEWPSGSVTWTLTPPSQTIGRLLTGLTARLAVRRTEARSEQPGLSGSGGIVAVTTERSLAPSVTASWIRGILTSFDASDIRSDRWTAGNLLRTSRSQRSASLSFTWRPPASVVQLKSDIRTSAGYTYSLNTICLRATGQSTCLPFVDSRRTDFQLTMDTSFPPSLSAGLQMAYVLNDERQISRRTSQLVLTAFVQLNTSVGQIR